MSTVDVGITFLEKTYKDVDRLIVDQELSPRELVAIIRRASSNILMKVRMERTYKTDYDFITFNAYHANWLDIPITILFIIHKDQKTIKLNEVEWRDIKVHLISVILHEFKHDEQFSKRGVDMRAVYEKEIKGARQEYFFDALYIGCPDEVDAYACQTAVQLKMFYSLDKIRDMLRNIETGDTLNKNISRYMVMFRKGSIVRNRFFKKLFLYLNL